MVFLACWMWCYGNFAHRVRQKQKLRITLDCSIAKEIVMVLIFLLREGGRLSFLVTSEAEENILYWRKIRKTTANKLITAQNRTLTSKEPWNKKRSKSTNHKLQTMTFWTLWNEHLLPKWATFEKSWFSGRQYFYFSWLMPFVTALPPNLTRLLHSTASYAG